MDSKYLDLFKKKDVILPFLFVKHYKELDITPLQFLLLVNIINAQNNMSAFMNFEHLSKEVSEDLKTVKYNILDLINKDLLEISTISSNGRTNDRYNLDNLWKKILIIEERKYDAFDQGIIEYAQDKFGKILTYSDLDRIRLWQNLTSDIELQKAAINQSVHQEKYSIAYSEGILKNWVSQNILKKSDLDSKIFEGQI